MGIYGFNNVRGGSYVKTTDLSKEEIYFIKKELDVGYHITLHVTVLLLTTDTEINYPLIKNADVKYVIYCTIQYIVQKEKNLEIHTVNMLLIVIVNVNKFEIDS